MKIELKRELDSILKHNRDGSFSTRNARERILMLCADQLFEAGIANLSARGLKQKHVNFLVELWKKQGIGTATMKNRLCQLRWWAEKIGKQNLIPRSNEDLGIGRRTYVDNSKNRGKELDPMLLAKIRHERMKAALELQRYFGMRKEESLKFRPKECDKGNYIWVKYGKGGRPRRTPVKTPYQRKLLDRCHLLAGDGSMVPNDKTYYRYMKMFENECHRAGIYNVHGFRHQYVQDWYKEATGWDCPKAGGLSRKEMMPEQRLLDSAVRKIIAEAIGHSRDDLTAIYLGS